jgi:hypothetical protein
MKINEVISAWENYHSIPFTPNVLFFSISLVIGFACLIYVAATDGDVNKNIMAVLNVCFLVSAAGSFLYFLNESKAYDHWKNDIAEPFIASLPEQRAELKSIKVLDKDPDKQVYYASISFLSSSKQVKTFEGWMYLYEENTPNKNGYILYKDIPKTLGPGYDKGFLHIKVYRSNLSKQAVSAHTRSFDPPQHVDGFDKVLVFIWFLICSAVFISISIYLISNFRESRRDRQIELQTEIYVRQSFNDDYDEIPNTTTPVLLDKPLSKGRTIR